ncbi:luciferase-like protein [Scytonema sp. HK-05]|nr:hypothetical protein [Scytonema sp. HK-05]BAY43325.1 luciferase-like protein [Scytonema sp. HK-05]
MSEPRYGIWIPVGGNYGLLNHPLSLITSALELADEARSLLALDKN